MNGSRKEEREAARLDAEARERADEVAREMLSRRFVQMEPAAC